jgi:Family of unknown function (DUF5677)
MKADKTTRSNNVNKDLLKRYSKLSADMETLRLFPMKKNELEFPHLVQCAYVKSYDFVMHCCSNKDLESAFFRLPVLRSVCEDLIAISYLKTKPNNEVKHFLHQLVSDELYETILIQEAFFKKYNPNQIVVPSALIPIEDKNRIINKPKNKIKAEKEGFAILPSVSQMAKDTGLMDLYQYMYHATSKLVHFSPDTLLKMGWGDMDKETGIIDARVSYKNYSLYYNAFLTFYASYLFIKQTEAFESIIAVPIKIKKTADNLMREYNDIDWPEMTTFDHLNIKGPSSLTRLMNRVLARTEQK